jgi:hypothetical protein
VLGDSPRWSLLATRGDAPARWDAAAIYDPVRDRMILSGGFNPGVRTQHVWSLAFDGDDGGGEWSSFVPLGSWMSRGGHSAIYDKKRDRMVVFGGGWPNADSWSTFNDTWALRLSSPPQWDTLDAGDRYSSDHPPPRAFPALVHDPVGDRMILVGGRIPGAFGGSSFNDAWEFRLADPEWHRVASAGVVPPSWEEPAGLYDSRRDRFVFLEGDWLWALEKARHGWRDRRKNEPESDLIDAGHGRFPLSLKLEGPNPFSERLALELSLPEAAPARLDLFDVSGRRVWSREVAKGPGEQILVVNGLRHLPPGVFLLRLMQGLDSRVIRLVHAR